MKSEKNSKKAFAAGISCLVLAVAVGAGIWGSKSASKESEKAKTAQNTAIQNEQTAPVSANKNSTQTNIKKEETEKNSTVNEKDTSAGVKIENNDAKPQQKEEKTDKKSSSAAVYEDEEAVAKAEDTGVNPVFAWPVTGKIVMDYSADVPVFDQTLEQYRTNNCISISADKGEKVLAAAAGTVESIAHNDENGYVVTVFHGNGWRTTYGQLDENLAVKEGDIVNSGDLIGVVGAPSKYSVMLGNHMDFGVTENGDSIDPKTALAK